MYAKSFTEFRSIFVQLCFYCLSYHMLINIYVQFFTLCFMNSLCVTLFSLFLVIQDVTTEFTIRTKFIDTLSWFGSFKDLHTFLP